MIEEPLEILVAEDNPGDVRLIETGFEKSDIDCSVTVVDNGEAALDYLHRRNGHESRKDPDVLLLDLNLPRKTGRDVLDAIDDEPDLRSIPTLVLTSSRADNHLLETYQLGANGYFVKPVDPHEFISLMDRLATAIVSSGTLPLGEYADLDRAT